MVKLFLATVALGLLAFVMPKQKINQQPPWGFYAHKKINYFAVFLLPPQLLPLYKNNIDYISEHAVDPDMRRYAIKEEGPRHYIDLDNYGKYPFDSLPRFYNQAIAKYGEDSVIKNGIVPWHIQTMLYRLTEAFKAKDVKRILQLSAEIGHYIGDSHVPLHASSNHNGQHTNQHGIHGFWESRVPELLAEAEWDFVWDKADVITNPLQYTWKKVLESAKYSDTVLLLEAQLDKKFKSDQKYAYEKRNNIVIRQYSAAYTKAYDRLLKGMVEKRFRESVYSVASFWFTAWVNAGQPIITSTEAIQLTEQEKADFLELNKQWQSGKKLGKSCDE
jgi:hypothetical protein